MSNTSSTHTIKVGDNGTLKATTKDAESLNAALEKAARTASKVAQARAAGPAFAASRAAKGGGQDGEDSGIARGIGGMTGAAGRDFAKQSEGLGGLVRLYAVFAANIFAATAAFGALSKAMDTTNMIKGLDQLGASSGMNLGALSKRVFQLTDGAVSMREAMEATTKATAAGMSGKDLERLAVGAKKASQALGVDMTDALSRLSRGISKLEPELLDELGIFIRVDDAAAKYAQTLGKPVSALTDVQRRAAFANEALDQVERKFSSINIDANPYSKLAATFANVTQSILELVNKGLGPIAKLFAENSTLLGGALALIAGKLLSAAIPALGQWRNSLKDTAEEAAETAKTFRSNFDDKFQQKLEASFSIPKLTKDAEAAKKELASLTKASIISSDAIAASKKLSESKSVIAVMSGDASSKDIKNVERIAKYRRDALNDELAGNKTLDAATKARHAAELADLEKILAKYERIAAAKKKVATTGAALSGADRLTEAEANKKQGLVDPGKLSEMRDKALQNASAKAKALSNVADTTSILGVAGAMRALNVELAASNLNSFQKGITNVQAAVISVSTRIMGIATAFSFVGAAIGAVVGAGVAFYSFFAKADKQLEDTNSSIKDLNSNAKLTSTYLDNIFSMDTSNTRSSLNALANIMVTMSDKTKESLDNFQQFAKAAGWMDKFWDGIKGLFGKDLKATLATSLSESWVAGIEAAIIEGRPGAEAALEKLAVTLGTVGGATDRKSIANAINADLAKGGNLVREAAKEANNLTLNVKSSSDASTALNEKFKEGAKLSQDITKSFLPSDNLAKLGQEMMSVATLFRDASESPRDALREALDIAGNMSKLKLLAPEDQKALLSVKDRLKEYNDQVQEANERERVALAELKKLSEDRVKLENELLIIKLTNNASDRQVGNAQGKLDNAKNLEDAKRREAKGIRDDANTVAATGVALWVPKLDRTFLNGAEKLQVSIGTAFDKAALSLARVSLIGASGQAATDMEFRFSERDISIQERAIRATLQLAMATESLELTTSEVNVNAMAKGPDRDREEIAVKSRRAAEGKTAPELIAMIKALTDQKKLPGKTLEEMNPIAQGLIRALAAAQARGGAQAGLADLGAKRAEGVAKRDVGTIANQAAVEKESLVLESRRIELVKQRTGLLQQALDTESAMLLLMSQGVEKQALANKQKQEIVDIDAKLQALGVALGNAKEKLDISNLETEIKRVLVVKGTTKELQTQETTLQAITQAIAVSNQEFAKSEGIRANTVKIEESLRGAASARIDLESQMLGIRASLGDLSEKDRVQEEARIAGLRLGLELQNQEATLLNAKEAKLRKIAQQESAAILAIPAQDRDTEGGKVIDEQNVKRAETLRLYNAEYAAIQQINGLKAQGLAADTAAKQLLAEQADNMAKLVSATESLASVFGDVGTALGTSLQALATFGDTQAKYDMAKAERDKKLEANVDNNDEYFKLKKAEAKADKQNAKDQLTNMANVAGATKKMFSEKTVAHKALATLEKTLHLFRLGMDVKDMAMDAIKTGKEILNSGARATMSGTEAVVDTLAAIPPPFGWVAAGITAAMVASLLGGKGPKVNMAGNTAADRQETQGTGTSFNAKGERVENGGGVFGDPTEKSDSVRKALEIMKDNTIEGLKYDRSMLRALESIDASISGVSKGLTAVQGIRTGSSFGTKEGVTGKSGISGLFGSSTSQDITDAGIKVSGTFDALSRGMGQFLQYEDVLKTKSKSGFFGIGKSTSQSLETNYKALNGSLQEQITDIFKNATGLFTQVAKDMGKSATYVAETLAQLPVQMNASLKGLSGKDLESAFNAVVSSQLDAASAALFSEMKKYAEFGEGLLETTVRVVDTNAKIKVAFDSIGISISTLSYDASESLVTLVGGLSELNDGVKFFSDNFLTEAERLAPIQRNVTATLGELALEFSRPGIAAINTRKAFKDLVLSLNPAEEQSAKLYAELTRLAPAFVEVTEPLKKVLTLEEKRTSILNQQIEIYKLEGSELNALYATRAEQLGQLDDSLKVGQAYIYALQDENTLKGKLKTAYDKVASSIGNITSSIKTLQTYRDSLVMGAQSNLTPAEKYKEAKSQAEIVAGLAAGVLAASASAAEIQAKNDAINQLPTVSSAFLDASRVLYASSAQYNEDFSYIQKLIDSTTTSLIDQKTDAENQLDRLDQQVSSLSLISDNTASMAGLLETLNKEFSAYNLATINSNTAATAATKTNYSVNSIDMTSLTDMFARLFTPLIPLIPTQPTIMPVNDRMTELVANDSTVKAVEALTKEVVALRADAQAQAQAVVAVTVETSNQITDAVEDSYSDGRGTSWGSRTVVNLR